MHPPLQCLIADDELPARQVMEKYVQDTPGLAVAGIVRGGGEVLAFLKNHSADLLITDIRMPGPDGMELASYLKALKIKVILVSAYRDYAAASYDVDVVDYLVKPVRYERFLRAIEKVRGLMQQPLAAISNGNISDFIFLKADRKLHKVLISDIIFIASYSNYMKIHLEHESLIVRETMQRLEEKLPRQFFARVHKSFLVNLHKVKVIEGHRIIFEKGEVPIGEAYKEAFMRRLGLET